ncbi:hypothetical protein [Kocuria kalidii]|uniref:hypothetical protein n=1 Tax=Kocuria kalidii TaxID=3376283 RepID=UPI00379823B8
MQETNVPPSRFRWSALLWFLPAALVLLAVGIWAERPWWALALWVAIPVVFGVVIGVLGGRRTSAPDHAYGITSQGARSQGRLEVDVPVEQVMLNLRETVEQLPRYTLVELSGVQAQLTARMNMKSWGERITLRFHPLDPTRIKIEALCEPRLGTTMVDYGQGAKDLRTVLGAIEQRIPVTGTSRGST